MYSPALERHNDRVRRMQAWLTMAAVVLGVVVPAAQVATHVAALAHARLGWPEWPALLGVSAAGLAAGDRLVTRWARRRTDDPARSTRRYLRAFLGSWAVGAVLASLALRAAGTPPAGGTPRVADLLAALATAWWPFAAVALIERRRPAWLAHPVTGASPGAPAV